MSEEKYLKDVAELKAKYSQVYFETLLYEDLCLWWATKEISALGILSKKMVTEQEKKVVADVLLLLDKAPTQFNDDVSVKIGQYREQLQESLDSCPDKEAGQLAIEALKTVIGVRNKL